VKLAFQLPDAEVRAIRPRSVTCGPSSSCKRENVKRAFLVVRRLAPLQSIAISPDSHLTA
jgi:hypothetical protein